ncbi:MAG TPA: hypothetical protein VKG61_25245 [Streptosporangiaceae bacterium]|nr:hypothetical protein [Streptosporangiaceae bacterium]
MALNGVGRRQREVLTLMHQHGGVWPPHWRIFLRQKRAIFASLERRGLIRKVLAHTPSGRVHTYRLVTEYQLVTEGGGT